MQHGQGELSMPDGKIKKGLFENNKYKGYQLIKDELIIHEES